MPSPNAGDEAERRLLKALRTEFRVSDRVYRLVEIEGLARCHAWERLQDLAGDKTAVKHLGGTFRPFVEACEREGNKEMAAHFAHR